MGVAPTTAGPDLARSAWRSGLGDTLFRGVALAASAGSAFLLGWIALEVVDLAWPSIEHFGLSFVWTEAWDPVTEEFGALTFVYGTALTSLIALAIAVPVSIGIALFLTEIAPRRIAPRSAAAASRPSGRHTPTRSPGRTPSRSSPAAARPQASSSSATVHHPASSTTATAFARTTTSRPRRSGSGSAIDP